MIDIDALKRDKRPQSAWVVHALIDRLEAAEKELAELRSSMKFRTSLIGRTEAERDALRAKLEAAESDAAHQKALADSALRVAEGWEEKCNALRAKIEAMEKPESGFRERCTPAAPAGGSNRFPLYALPGAQQCKNCNGMGDRFDPSGEKIPCDLCESHLEEIRSLVAEAAHDIISGNDFWLSTSLAAKKICALPGAKGEEK